jgi:cell division protein FtsQ
VPPVMVRGGLAAFPAKEQHRGKRAKRRFDVSLDTPGAEMRLPSLPMVSFGWRLLSGLLVVILAFTLYTIWNSPMYKVKTVEVEGLQRLSEEDVNAVARVSNEPIFKVDPLKVQVELEKAFPELYDVSVDVKMPASVLVKVAERQPVIAWIQDGNEVWVDSTGMAFPKRGDKEPGVVIEAEDSPLSVTNVTESESSGDVKDEPKRFLPAQTVNGILALSFQAPENTQLLYNNSHGIGWNDKRGWKVFFGKDPDNVEMKLQVYKAIVKQLSKKKIQPTFISVEYVHAPYYRIEH